MKEMTEEKVLALKKELVYLRGKMEEYEGMLLDGGAMEDADTVAVLDIFNTLMGAEAAVNNGGKGDGDLVKSNLSTETKDEMDLDKETNSKIVPICIRFLQYTDFCGDTYTQFELLSAGEYGILGVPLNLATMFVRFETWQLDSENKPILNNVSNRIPPLPANDIAVLTALINGYNNRQIQSNCQFRNMSDVDGWSNQKMIARSASGPWYVVQIANVSVPPIITMRFGINQVNLTNNTLMNSAQIVINQLVNVNILPTFRECGDLPAFITINMPGLDNAGLAIAVATQTAIGANIQAQILNDMSNSNIPTTGITFTVNTNAVPFPSIVITSP